MMCQLHWWRSLICVDINVEYFRKILSLSMVVTNVVWNLPSKLVMGTSRFTISSNNNLRPWIEGLNSLLNWKLRSVISKRTTPILTIQLYHVLFYQIATHRLNPCRRALNNSSKYSPKSSSFTRIRNIEFIYLKWHLWLPDHLLTSKSMLKYLALQSTRNDATR
jgi:hypothetical protein